MPPNSTAFFGGNMEPVVPGEFVGYEEEFMPGFGTYSENGDVYSSNIGELEKDVKKREVKVKVKTRIPMFFKRGMSVYGRIAQMTDNIAVVDIIPMVVGQFYYVPRPVTHILPISEVKRGYTRSMRDEFRIGDIIKAKILSMDQHTVTLTTKAMDLGVVKAFCTQCRHPLVKDKNALKCPNCGNIEHRKVSVDYGKIGGILYETEGSRGERE